MRLEQAHRLGQAHKKHTSAHSTGTQDIKIIKQDRRRLVVAASGFPLTATPMQHGGEALGVERCQHAHARRIRASGLSQCSVPVIKQKKSRNSAIHPIRTTSGKGQQNQG